MRYILAGLLAFGLIYGLTAPGAQRYPLVNGDPAAVVDSTQYAADLALDVN